MRMGFYPKLAVSGIRKNGKTYIPYLLTCIFMIMTSYLLYFLMNNARIAQMKGGDALQEMLHYGSGVFSIFSLIFLFYTNSFLIRRRKREFGLYNVLGMGKRNVARILVWETIQTAFIAFIGGLALGILLSKTAELAMAVVLDAEVSLEFSVEGSAVLKTLQVFAVIFVLILLNSLRQIRMTNPIELLRSSAEGEKAPRGNLLLAGAGVTILGAAYYIAVTIENPLAALTRFFVAVLMVIISTYLLFIAGSVVLCRILKRRKSYYYKPNHFVSVSTMMYRMKRSGAGLASICVLSTTVLVMVSAVVCLYMGKETSLKERYPNDIQVEAWPADDKYLDQIHTIVRKEAEATGETVKNVTRYRYLAVTAFLTQDQVDFRSYTEGAEFGGYAGIEELFFVPLEDYNEITGAEEELAEGEILVSCIRGENYGFPTMTLQGWTPWRVKKEVPEFVPNGDAMSQIISSLFIVVPDMETVERIYELQEAVYNGYKSSVQEYYGFDMTGSEEDKIALTRLLRERMKQLEVSPDDRLTVNVSGLADEKSSCYGLYGGLFVLGILLGSVFVIATVLIMYYKQITEGYEDQVRFEVMQKVGMTKREIRRSINSQMLTVFFAPLALAGIHLLFAFPAVYKLLILFGIMDRHFFAVVTLGCFLVFAVFYVIVYLITARAYYRIVSE